ncbi:MAG: hypothetical protein K9L30_06915 [Desulfobacterales bacterium]|nr:hypothetical protein [Desulfobacterales bacterium]
MKLKNTLIAVVLISIFSTTAFARLKARDFRKLVGYTIVEMTNVSDEFEGADFDKPVALDNGMVFRFNTYNYTYSYRPDVVVLAKKITLGKESALTWKLIIEDEIYDVTRVK